MTQIIQPTEENILICSEEIKNGELVGFPTETVYGLGADAFNENAVKKIFIAKGRPQDNPLIVHISNLEEIEKVATEIPKLAYELAERYMPGPLTLVLKKNANISDVVTANGNTVGIRMPNNDIARKLIKYSNPIAAPSANVSKHISPTTAKHVLDDLNGKIKYILDGGECTCGIESTVLDLTSDIPTILRPGAVTKEMIESVLGHVKDFKGEVKVAKAPGMKYKHYSPNVDSILVATPKDAMAVYSRNKNAVILGLKDFLYKCEDANTYSLGEDAKDYMRNIYSALRYAEKKYEYIIVQRLKGNGIEESIMNRVLKATNNNMYEGE